ncbi:uncharacterized protein LOC116161445 [Photinus pyralis]|uniref:uncharacterized protein LOC116161445 n=1 Tax=Photinus pyralis TaxID=7054 RepID=UPI001267537D|nr:uncharacterized protein LOC116161445 [Photinus pyralis]
MGDSEVRKRSANFTSSDRNLLLQILQDFKETVENKKTDSQTWKTKDDAWDKVAKMFNSQTQQCPRTKDSLRKYYENLKRTVRKRVANDRLQLNRTGGGAISTDTELWMDLLLNLINQKTVYGLVNIYDGDADVSLPDTPDCPVIAEQTIEELDDHCYATSPSAHVVGDCETPSTSLQDWNNVAANDLPRPISKGLVVGDCETPSTSGLQDWSKVAANDLSQPLSKGLKRTWTKRRRPGIQQQSSSKLTEEYSMLAKMKLQLCEMEKENISIRTERENIIFELSKKKLENEIKIQEFFMSKYNLI